MGTVISVHFTFYLQLPLPKNIDRISAQRGDLGALGLGSGSMGDGLGVAHGLQRNPKVST